ncbi:MerR family DNA-binding protein, partial [Clostridium perfringens]
LILGIKYLGISLSEIKEITENGDIEDYYNLIQKQKDIIKERILELKQLEESLDNSGQVINRIMNFKNQYDFSKVNVENLDLKLYEVKVRSALGLENESKVEKKLIELKEESYFYFYKIKDNKHIIEEENLLFIKFNENIENFLVKSKNKDKITFKSIQGKFALVDFYGSVEEIHNYILSINEYFKGNKDNYAFIEYEFYLPKKREEVKYFVRIYLSL